MSSSYNFLFATHSLSRGHFFFARLPSQSPQMVMSWLHGTKPPELWASASFLIFALRAFSMLVTFDIFWTKATVLPFFNYADMVGSLHINPSYNSAPLS